MKSPRTVCGWQKNGEMINHAALQKELQPHLFVKFLISDSVVKMSVCLIFSTRKDVGLDLFFPKELIDSMKVQLNTESGFFLPKHESTFMMM